MGWAERAPLSELRAAGRSRRVARGGVPMDGEDLDLVDGPERR